MTEKCQVCQVNPAITDAVTQVNVKVVAEAPAMAMIGEQLTGLIRQEIDACFRQYVDLLTVRLDAIYDRLQSIGASPTESPESTAPDAAATAVVHDTPGPASM